MGSETGRGINYYGASTSIFRVARDIAADVAVDEDTPGAQPEVLGVLILAAVAVEGLLNELGAWVAQDPGGAPWRPDQHNFLGAAWEMAEKSRAGLGAKYKLVVQCIAGWEEDFGQRPHQDFQLLADVRNRLVHPKVGYAAWVDERFVDTSGIATRLRQRELLLDPGLRMNAHWVALIQNRTAADWALHSASAAVTRLLERFIEVVPEDWGDARKAARMDFEPWVNAFSVSPRTSKGGDDEDSVAEPG